MTEDAKLPEAEVKAMLEKLRAHFGEPVMPVGQYCAALGLWASALRMKVDRAEKAAAAEPESEYCKDDLKQATEFANEVGHVFLMIGKSNLLSRLIYEGESLRTTMCPEHKGRWSGCVWHEDASKDCACQRTQSGGVGSNVTGWLP
jgi:hypothetical protein